jgi:hypothetical protein
MLKFVLGFMLTVSTIVHADVEKTTIKEIKKWSQSVPAETTCVDDYLLRRRQLGIRMGLTPLVIAGSTAVGVFGGSFIGYNLFVLSGAPVMGFADLAALAAGGTLGGAAALGISSTTSTLAVVDFVRTQNLLRLVYECRQEGGLAVDGFYEAYEKNYPGQPMTKEEFMSAIEELDTTGKLCDGSIVNPKRYKKGKKLKQRLANAVELFNKISQK